MASSLGVVWFSLTSCFPRCTFVSICVDSRGTVESRSINLRLIITGSLREIKFLRIHAFKYGEKCLRLRNAKYSTARIQSQLVMIRLLVFES